jgi:hypothetical protein
MTEAGIIHSTRDEILNIPVTRISRRERLMRESDNLLEILEQLNLQDAILVPGELKPRIINFLKECDIPITTTEGLKIKNPITYRLPINRALDLIFKAQEVFIGRLFDLSDLGHESPVL